MDLFGDLSARGARPALCEPSGRSVTYEELAALVAEEAAKLAGPRKLALLEASNCVESVVRYLACLRQGVPVVLAAPDRPKTTEESIAALGVGVHFHQQGGSWVTSLHDSKTEVHPDLAVILSTSGSTGSAKYVRLSRDNVRANAASIAEYLGITPEDRAATTLPPYYSYGLSVINSHLLAGASLLLTEASVADDAFWQSFVDRGCNNFAGVPHTYKILRQRGLQAAELARLRYATQAGGRLAPEHVAWMAGLAKEHGFDFYVMYGQTEATARMAYLPPNLTARNPGSIGVAIPGGKFTLLGEQGQELSEPNREGELVYSGPNVMMGYAERATDLAKGRELDELRTGDLARRDEQGLHYIVGRKSRFLKLFGLRINLDDVEAKVKALGHDAIATGDDEQLLVLVTGKGDDATASSVSGSVASGVAGSISSGVAAWLKIPVSAVQARCVAEPPLLPNEKPDYRAIRELFATPTGPSLGTPKVSVGAVFKKHFGATFTGPSDSFASLGGDSLSYVQVGMELEKQLGQLPSGWSSMTVAELEARGGGTASWLTRLDTTILVRALAILFIVAGHFGVFALPGGAHLLLVVAGLNFARFQLPAIKAADGIQPIARLAAKVAVPTVGYLLLLELAFRSFSWPATLLVGNWVSPRINSGFAFWFVEVYIQLLLVVGLLFAMKPVREKLLSGSPWVDVSLVGIGGLMATVGPLLWDTSHLYNRVPHMLFVLFAVGFACAHAKGVAARLLVSAAATLFAWPNPVVIVPVWVMLWLPEIPVPKLVVPAISSIAGASLFIYLTHFQFSTLGSKLYGGHPLVHLCLAVAGGILVWRAYDWATRTLSGAKARRDKPVAAAV